MTFAALVYPSDASGINNAANLFDGSRADHPLEFGAGSVEPVLPDQRFRGTMDTGESRLYRVCRSYSAIVYRVVGEYHLCH